MTKEELTKIRSLQGQANALLKKTNFKFIKRKKHKNIKNVINPLKQKKKFFKSKPIKEFYQSQEFINHII